jgi:hypothetical protein
MKNGKYKIDYKQKTKLEDFFQEPLYVSLYHGGILHKSSIFQFIYPTDNEDEILNKFNKLDYDFNYFVIYKDNFEAIRQYFDPYYQFDYLAYLIYNKEFELTEISKGSIQFIFNKTGHKFKTEEYFNSIIVKKKNLKFEEILSTDETKNKLKQLILFDCSYSTDAQRKKDELITKLEKLDSLGILPNDLENKDKILTINTGKFRISKGRKTDFIKILNAMYECRIFETEKGFLASNKQELFNEFGILLKDDLTKYSTLLSKSKETDKAIFLSTFKELERKSEAYYDNNY